MILSTCVEAFIGTFQYLYFLIATNNVLQYAIRGTYDNPAGFAASLCVVIPFVLELCRDSKLKNRRIGSLILCWFALLLLLSGSRTAIVSILSLLVLCYCFDKKVFLKITKRTLIKTLLFFCLGIFFLTILYFIKKDSADGRLLIWNSTWKMILENPIFGYGINGFKKNYMNFQAVYLKETIDTSFLQLADDIRHPFNEILNIATHFGIVGVLLLFLFLLGIILCYRFYSSNLGKSSLLSLFVIFLFSQFSYPFSYPFIWIVTLFACSVILHSWFINIIKKRKLRYVLVLLLFIFGCYSIHSGTRRLYGEVLWKEAVNLFSLGRKLKALDKYKESYSVMKDNSYFLYNYAVALYQSSDIDRSYQIAKRCNLYWANYDLEVLLGVLCFEFKEYNKAEEHYKRAHWMCPCRFVPLEYLLDLYLELGDTQKQIVLAQQIQKKVVKVDSERVRFIKNKADIVLNCE